MLTQAKLQVLPVVSDNAVFNFAVVPSTLVNASSNMYVGTNRIEANVPHPFLLAGM